jgi:predicted lipoprotein with Yx(FWY)xxD motif
MKRLILSIGSLAAVLALAVGLDSALAANHSPGAAAKVAVANSGLGRVLVDARGRTLYLFEKDNHGKSACTGKCAGFWPPLITSGKPLAKAGATASLLGTTRRTDGRLQVTYDHHPLYTFANDTQKGQTNGEELDAFGAAWYAISAAGAKVEKNDVTSSGSTVTTTGGYGYGY